MKPRAPVFYIWQNSRPPAACKNLILESLCAAIDELQADTGLELDPVLDRDTQGLPGSPSIADVILRKIDEAAVAVADVSRALRDAPAVAKMRELSARYPAYGYRRIGVFLAREGHKMSADRAHRLWRRAGLQVPRKRPRRRVATSRPRPTPPDSRNHVWAIDFVFDACANGQQLKCMTVVDEWTRECLAIHVASGIRSKKVIEVLTRECLAIHVASGIRSKKVIEVLAQLVSVRGAPRHLRSDNGPEFVSRALLRWVLDEGIETALIDPGKPWQNGVDESFNGRFRDECLSMEYFRCRAEAVTVIETWRRHYNGVRPHSSLGYLTPNEFAQEKLDSTRMGAGATL